jgi:MerR family mercuric resistance operon transcriptional regulator
VRTSLKIHRIFIIRSKIHRIFIIRSGQMASLPRKRNKHASCSHFRIKALWMTMIEASPAEHWPIGKLSRLTGISVEAIRYYERIEILPKPTRNGSGRRVYGAADLRFLVSIRRAREIGFSLEEIRALLRLGQCSRASCREAREIAAHHLKGIRAKLARLREHERLLAKTVARCSGDADSDCPVLEVLDISPPQQLSRQLCCA